MQLQRFPGIPWVHFAPRGAGFYVRCTACRMESVGNGAEMQGFARAHASHQSQSPTHRGLGDAVAALTHRMGIEPCAPCEARRYRLNQLVPQLFRR